MIYKKWLDLFFAYFIDLKEAKKKNIILYQITIKRNSYSLYAYECIICYFMHSAVYNVFTHLPFSWRKWEGGEIKIYSCAKQMDNNLSLSVLFIRKKV